VGFSSDSKLLAIGNETGNVVVYKFKHYEWNLKKHLIKF
jgi:hypothetical protein